MKEWAGKDSVKWFLKGFGKKEAGIHSSLYSSDMNSLVSFTQSLSSCFMFRNVSDFFAILKNCTDQRLSSLFSDLENWEVQESWSCKRELWNVLWRRLLRFVVHVFTKGKRATHHLFLAGKALFIHSTTRLHVLGVLKGAPGFTGLFFKSEIYSITKLQMCSSKRLN